MESSHLILGIDTGGTFTDAVVVDPAGQRILKATKALTTHADLTRGIEQAIRQLELSPGEVLATVVSTTLATNAVVEGQTRPVALALIGYDPALMEQFRLDRNIFATVTAHFPGGHDVFGQARPGFDPDAVARWARSCWPAVEAFAVSAYFSPLDPHCETEAAAAIQAAIRQRLSAPIVLGSQLTASLGAVKRATTASLNASLLPIALEFMQAVSQAATPFTRGLLLSCRGDGTLMRLQTAVARPIDTVASGPAASALGAAFLAHRSTALVVDVGGTTSDITLVVDGSPRLSPEGATVGGYPTAVPAIEVETLGLGGDSRVHLASPTLADSVMTSAVVASPAPTGPGATGLWGRPDEPLAIGPDRVIPLARLAARHPRVLSELKALVAKPSLSPDDAAYLEYWFLTGDITGESRSTGLLTSAKRELIDVLSSGPLSTPDLL
ncbi:MAG TPA: hydantoinase/oxoprolinase family protein, partial [Firmicutes bacterium]|nr:hydantoinase/oxoprolinase family protein [Bacillota bacterium]